MALAISGLLYASLVSIAILLFGGSAATRLYRVIGTRRASGGTVLIAGISIFFLALMIAVLTPVILAPSTLYDPLATHLVDMRLSAIRHGLYPSGEYSYLPQGFELMMGAAYLLGRPAGRTNDRAAVLCAHGAGAVRDGS